MLSVTPRQLRARPHMLLLHMQLLLVLLSPTTAIIPQVIAQCSRTSSLRRRSKGQDRPEADGHLELSDHHSPGVSLDDKSDRAVRSKCLIADHTSCNDGPGLSKAPSYNVIIKQSATARWCIGCIDHSFDGFQPSCVAKFVRWALPVTTDDPWTPQRR